MQEKIINGETVKDFIGRHLAVRVNSGDLIGVGTGSTVSAVVSALGLRIKKGELNNVSAVTTSYQSSIMCQEAGLVVLDTISAPFSKIAFAFDGADEVDPTCRLIKGKGAAMLREKIVAQSAEHFVVLIDDSKISDRLGSLAAVPVEIVPESLGLVKSIVSALKGFEKLSLRDALPGKHGPVVTERGNLILDVNFIQIDSDIPSKLSCIPGVVEHGIFQNLTSEVWVAKYYAEGQASSEQTIGAVEETSLNERFEIEIKLGDRI